MDLDLKLLHLDTLTLLILNAIAVGFFLSISVMDELARRKARKKNLLNNVQRSARLKRLYGKL